MSKYILITFYFILIKIYLIKKMKEATENFFNF